MARPPRPDDLYGLRIATDIRIAPDGSAAAMTVQTVAARRDDYRHALWLVPFDGRDPRQLTIGLKHDRHARFSPDGRTVAFLSDRRTLVEDEQDRGDANAREDGTQVHLLPLDGGEARRLTDLPRGVDGFEWSPDGTRLIVLTTSHGATMAEDARRRRKSVRRLPGSVPESDNRFIDRLSYMLNGTGFTYDRVAHLWLVDVATGLATRLTDGPTPEHEPAWSPDGSRIAFAANRRRNPDLIDRSDVFVVDVATGAITSITAGPDSIFFAPAWLPDGRSILALGHRREALAGTRNDIWRFAADGSDARPVGGTNLSAAHDLMPGSGMAGDVQPHEEPRLEVADDGSTVTFTAPVRGSYELWRLAVADGSVERLTEGRHHIASYDQAAPGRIAYLRATATSPADVWCLDPGVEPRQVTTLNADHLAGLELHEPLERWATVDGRKIQGWLVPAGEGRRPLVVEIHGGPHTLYGWTPMWEFQVLAAAGMSVYYANPRGSEGYGQAFNAANRRDWGAGPARDVLAGVDALVADGLADPDRLGLTGGSYGGYLTSWIVGHDDRFRAAMTCRSVNDVSMLFLTSDISGGQWAEEEFGGTPWSDPEYFREISPLAYAANIHTPLLIQHSERDLRTTIGQAEALFTVLRSLRRPVRLLRVPEETHELTRSGTPFRRVANLEMVIGWFRHYLVDGKTGLPPVPRVHGGR